MRYLLVDTANTFFRARHSAHRQADTWDKLGFAIHVTLASINKSWRDQKADQSGQTLLLGKDPEGVDVIPVLGVWFGCLGFDGGGSIHRENGSKIEGLSSRMRIRG